MHVARPRVEEVRVAEWNGEVQRLEPQAGIAGRGEREDFEGAFVIIRGQARERGLRKHKRVGLARERERDPAVDLIELVGVHPDAPAERRRVHRDAGADPVRFTFGYRGSPSPGKVTSADACPNAPLRIVMDASTFASRRPTLAWPFQTLSPLLRVKSSVSLVTSISPRFTFGQADVQLVERELPVGRDRERDPRVGRGVAAEVEERRELDVGRDLRRGLADRTRNEAQLQLAGHRQHAEVVRA